MPTSYVMLRAGHVHGTLLLLWAPQKWQLAFLVSLYLIVYNLTQLRMQAVFFCFLFFNLLEFLCILLLWEMFAQMQALQLRVPDPSLPQSGVV